VLAWVVRFVVEAMLVRTATSVAKCGMYSPFVVQLPLDGERVDLVWFCRGCHHEWSVLMRDAEPSTALSAPRQVRRPSVSCAGARVVPVERTRGATS
jgi:hypothetical protein